MTWSQVKETRYILEDNIKSNSDELSFDQNHSKLANYGLGSSSSSTSRGM